MIDLDFLEIGCCDFETLLETADPDAYGILVEPIKIYLDRLPDLKNVIKVNVAISPHGVSGEIDVYYVPPESIESNENLPSTLKGCNSINKIHPEHINWGVEGIVQVTKVKMLTLPELLEKYQVRGIKHLKIDIEGGDSKLLINFVKYLIHKPIEYYPKKITFETNVLTSKEEIEKVIRLYSKLGYIVVERDINTIMELIS